MRQPIAPETIPSIPPRRGRTLRCHPALLIHCLLLTHRASDCNLSGSRRSTTAGSAGTSSPLSGHANTATCPRAVIRSACPRWTAMFAPTTSSVRSVSVDRHSASASCVECTIAQSVPPDDTLPGQEASETEICGERAAEHNDPWDVLYDEDGNYIPDLVYDGVGFRPAERERRHDL